MSADLEQRAREIAEKLTKAERQGVLSATLAEKNNVRWTLLKQGIIRDYIDREDRLTPLGLAVRAALRLNTIADEEKVR